MKIPEPQPMAAATQPLSSNAMPASIYRRGKQKPIGPPTPAPAATSPLEAARGDDDLMSEPPEAPIDAGTQKS